MNRIAIIALVGTWFMPLGHGQERLADDAQEKLASIHVRSEPYETQVGDHFTGFLHGAFRQNGKDVASGLKLRHNEGKTGDVHHVGVLYPHLVKDDVVPVRGDLFRVDSVYAGPGGGSVTLLRLKDDDSRRGLAPAENGFGLPLAQGIHGSANVNKVFLVVKSIDARKVDPAQPVDPKREPEFEARLRYFLPEGHAMPSDETVRKGSTLLIDGRRYLVHRIVPRDDSRRIIGWVEISRQPKE